MALGHRRLSIIDLSAAGNQPMANEDHTVFAVVNGEIYNFEELRRDLAARGHAFRSRSDSEIVVHLYEERGEDFVTALRGMFALAVWDSRARKLLLARDRVGKKPLYYAAGRDGFRFASELVALREALPEAPRANLDALQRYLTLQYVPSPMTAFEGVEKLPAAHLLTIEPGRPPTVRRYWTLSFAPGAPVREGDAVKEVRALLEESVRLRQIADVPLGAFLSGGVDSSAVVGLMARASSQRIKTFTIDFPGGAGEAGYARMVAKRWNTEHHEMMVNPDMTSVLPDLVRRYGEPFADTSAVPVYFLSQMTRQHVIVALSGDGGDEVFAGYKRYGRDRIARGINRMPAPVAALAKALLRNLPGAGMRGVREYGEHLSLPAAERYLFLIAHFTRRDQQDLLGPALRPYADADPVTRAFTEILARSDAGDDVNRLLDLDTQTYLPDDILTKVDIASMAHALEVRAPFVDHVLMERMAALAGSLKFRGFRGKRLLRRATADLVPRAILTRRKKGFSLPVDAWLRAELRPMAHDLLTGPSVRKRGLLEPRGVARLLDEHERGVDHGERLWNLLCLELWHRTFIDQAR